MPSLPRPIPASLALVLACHGGGAGDDADTAAQTGTASGTASGTAGTAGTADTAGTDGSASGATADAGSDGSDGDSSGGDTGPNVTPGGPALFFSDLVIAPRRGNSDTSAGQRAGVDGAIVTVWGKNLGDSQGDSIVSVGGVAARVLAWGPAQHGADLYTRLGLQSIALQIPGDAPLGDTTIEVTVADTPSNALPLRTHDDGAIRFVAPDGDDGSDGSWDAPWASFDQVAASIEPGDVVYFLDGFVDVSGQGSTGFFGLDTSGTADRPKAIVAYPGATVTVGGDACEPTGHALIASYSPELDGASAHWVISQLRVLSPADCAQDTAVSLGDGYRLVGSYLSTPRTGDGCQSGAVQCGGLGSCGDGIFVLGNELDAAQTANADTGSKQCHGFYISGNRVEDGVESGREIAWNWIHDCANNRAINIYNESYNGEGQPRARIEGHAIHDNWVENQRGIGLLMGQDITGDNWVYNNVFVNTGLGPEFTDGGGFFPFQLQPGSTYAPSPTTLWVVNNLVWGASFPDGPDWARGLVFYAQGDQVTLELHDNIFVATQAGIDYVGYESSPLPGTHNLWFGAGAPPPDQTEAIAADPSVVDPAANDFHLQDRSPARNAGTPQPVGALDFDGMPRSDDGWSVGPYQ